MRKMSMRMKKKDKAAELRAPDTPSTAANTSVAISRHSSSTKDNSRSGRSVERLSSSSHRSSDSRAEAFARPSRSFEHLPAPSRHRTSQRRGSCQDSHLNRRRRRFSGNTLGQASAHAATKFEMKPSRRGSGNHGYGSSDEEHGWRDGGGRRAQRKSSMGHSGRQDRRTSRRPSSSGESPTNDSSGRRHPRRGSNQNRRGSLSRDDSDRARALGMAW